MKEEIACETENRDKYKKFKRKYKKKSKKEKLEGYSRPRVRHNKGFTLVSSNQKQKEYD